MAKKQYLDLNGLTTYDEQIKAYIDSGDAATSTKLTSGTIVVKEAEHSEAADEATHATSADSATTAESATKATQDGDGKVISSTYETKTNASEKLAEAKTYTDTVAETVKNDLLNGAGEAYDTLKELGDLIDDNADAIDVLEAVASGKADAIHTHTVANITDLTATATELNYLEGVESNVQAQLDSTMAAVDEVKISAITTDDEELKINSLNVSIGGLNCDNVSELPCEFTDGHVVMYNNEIHILDISSKTHYKFNSVDSSWTKLEDLPFTSQFYAVVYNDEMYAIIYYNAYTQLYKYDGSSWTWLETMSFYNFIDRYSMGSTVIYNNELHLLGGINSVYGKYHYKWDGTTWTRLDDLPYWFSNGSAVVYNGEIHIFGGNGSGYYKKEHYKFDGSTWTQLDDLPCDFEGGSAIVYNNEIYLLGNSFSTNTNNKSFYKFDGSTWTQLDDLPYEFNGRTTIVYNDDIHILGGNSTNAKNHYKLIFAKDKLISFTIDSDKTIPFVTIDDEASSTDTVYSSSKVEEIIDDKIFPAITEDGDSLCINSLNLQNENLWSEVSSLPYSRSSYGYPMVVLNDEIHILGSDTSSTHHYKFNSSTSEWIEVSTLPYDITGACAVVYNNEIHLLGGSETNPDDMFSTITLDYHYAFNPSTETWTQMEALPCGFNGNAVVLNNEIYIVGGVDEEGYPARNHYKYDGSTWTELKYLPCDFLEGSVVVYNNEVHILGGIHSALSHYKFDSSTSTWIQLDDLPYEFYDSSAVVYNNEIHLLGSGYYSSPSYPYSKYHYKFDGSSWNEVKELPYEFHQGSAVVYNDEIHLLGGYDVGNNHYKFKKINTLSSFTIDSETVPITTINDKASSDSTTYSSNKINALLGVEITDVLTAGQTSLTLTDNRITTDSILDAVYTSIFGVPVKSAEFSNGSLTLTFNLQTENMTVKAVIK